MYGGPRVGEATEVRELLSSRGTNLILEPRNKDLISGTEQSLNIMESWS